jgi:hypothetical protein
MLHRVFLFAAISFLAGVSLAYGQHAHIYDQVFAFLPARLPGYATDPPMVTVEDDGFKTYTNVSVMFYTPDGEKLVEIKLKDFNLNPKNYEEEFEAVKKAIGSYAPALGRSFTYENYTAFEKRTDKASSWILFLGDLVILEVVYTAKEEGFAVVQEVVKQLNLSGMKQAFMNIRAKGR